MDQAKESGMENFSIDRSKYDMYNKEKLAFSTGLGLSEDIVRKISAEKNEPEWMLQKRLSGLILFNEFSTPKWGPDISQLDLSKIQYFMKPDANKNATNWDDVPEDIKNTFEKLGIPEAERKSLAGVGAQYESEVVYHKLREEFRKIVIFV